MEKQPAISKPSWLHGNSPAIQMCIRDRSAVEQRLVFHAIADKEGITVSDEDRDNLAAEMGYESKDQMIESAGAYNVDDYLISTKTMKFLVDNAVIK